MKNQSLQDFMARKHETKRRKRCFSKQKASSTVVPKGYYQDTKTHVAKDA
jgi:hypothetical protein